MNTPLHPVAQAQIDAARVKPTLDELLDMARAEACRIESVQRALVDCGHLGKPDGGQIRKAVCWDAMARWIERERRGGYA